MTLDSSRSSSFVRSFDVRSQRAFRSPKRITITLPFGTYQTLVERSDQQGRSLSNLAAFLLESATSEMPQSSSSPR